MAKPKQGPIELLNDPAAQGLLESTQPAHLSYSWSDGSPRCIPIWFHWNGKEVVMAGPRNAPRTRVLTSGAPVAITIDTPTWPYESLCLRGVINVESVTGPPAEYQPTAERYLGAEGGRAWCEQIPADMAFQRLTMKPEWVGVLDFNNMRRIPSALAG